jgi:hypothetical protein
MGAAIVDLSIVSKMPANGRDGWTKNQPRND